MSRRLKITLPDPIAAQLEKLAAGAGEPVARVASQMIRAAVTEALTGSKATAQPGESLPDPQLDSGERAPWLEPYQEDQEWHAWAWREIVALCRRYPQALGALKEGWWEEATRFETLCALAMWRWHIDQMSRDPRDELAFQAELAAYGRALRSDAGSVADVWEPRRPPETWPI